MTSFDGFDIIHLIFMTQTKDRNVKEMHHFFFRVLQKCERNASVYFTVLQKYAWNASPSSVSKSSVFAFDMFNTNCCFVAMKKNWKNLLNQRAALIL